MTGFIAGALTATIHNALSDEKIDVFTAGTQGAIGGAISGAGVDAALLLIGSFGTAHPVVALAGGIAYMAGGLGNAYTTYLASNGTASDEEIAVVIPRHLSGLFLKPFRAWDYPNNLSFVPKRRCLLVHNIYIPLL